MLVLHILILFFIVPSPGFTQRATFDCETNQLFMLSVKTFLQHLFMFYLKKKTRLFSTFEILDIHKSLISSKWSNKERYI